MLRSGLRTGTATAAAPSRPCERGRGRDHVRGMSPVFSSECSSYPSMMRHALLSLPFIAALAIGCSDDAENDGGGGAGGSGDTTGASQNGPTTTTKSGPSTTKTGGSTATGNPDMCQDGPLAEPI